MGQLKEDRFRYWEDILDYEGGEAGVKQEALTLRLL